MSSTPDWKPLRRIRSNRNLRTFRLAHYGEPCDLCGVRRGTEVHHKTFRSQGGDDLEENLLWLCVFCHDGIHAGRRVRYLDSEVNGEPDLRQGELEEPAP